MTTPTARPDTNEDFDYIAFALKRMWGERDEASAKFPSSIEAWAQYDRLRASLAEANDMLANREGQLAEARAAASCCDDVRLDQPVANIIAELQEHRQRLERRLAEAEARAETADYWKRMHDEVRAEYIKAEARAETARRAALMEAVGLAEDIEFSQPDWVYFHEDQYDAGVGAAQMAIAAEILALAKKESK